MPMWKLSVCMGRTDSRIKAAELSGKDESKQDEQIRIRTYTTNVYLFLDIMFAYDVAY